MRIAENTIITMNYVVTGKDRNVIDNSYANSPLKFIYGKGRLPPGLESRLKGLRLGDKKKIIISAEHGYGLRNKKLIIKVHKNELPKNEYKIGTRLRRLNANLKGDLFIVKGYLGEWVYLDKNHPLAGLDLTYNVIILSVDSVKPSKQKATKEQPCLKIIYPKTV